MPDLSTRSKGKFSRAIKKRSKMKNVCSQLSLITFFMRQMKTGFLRYKKNAINDLLGPKTISIKIFISRVVLTFVDVDF